MKWFYPLQEKAEQKIEESYERSGVMLWQDVCKTIVYERYDARRKSDGKYVQILVTMHKGSGFIFIYECVN